MNNFDWNGSSETKMIHDIVDLLIAYMDDDPELKESIQWADRNIEGKDIYEKMTKVFVHGRI